MLLVLQSVWLTNLLTVMGNIARQFLTGAIYQYIKNKQYDLAARLMFNTLVKAGFKVNAIGLAAEAATYGWQCRNA
ncbi:hypothetical protein [Oceanobacillus sp. J11TS1]|uniref:hypothetical protein n=1 Tax=Oceanobacillus sp. J11TS1 TaxID=2807191 RepID=UPI001BB32F42|nr:hypothetical protein [Oceanobacillus sp. J11TS1]